MILAAQGCGRVYFTDSDDVLQVDGNRVLLLREFDGGCTRRSFIMGEYSTPERAAEVLREAVSNLDAGGLIFPEV